jgi:hypothetical protein
MSRVRLGESIIRVGPASDLIFVPKYVIVVGFRLNGTSCVCRILLPAKFYLSVYYNILAVIFLWIAVCAAGSS